MHPEEMALLEAVMAAPDCLATRLVAADWYEERGDAARAEFIRVQLALHKLPSSHSWRQEFQWTSDHLLAKHRAEWDAALTDRLDTSVRRRLAKGPRRQLRGWDYRRGFVESLEVRIPKLVKDWDALRQLGPIREAVLVAAGGSESHSAADLRALRALFRWPGLESFRKLSFPDFSWAARPALWRRQLLDSRHTGGLEELEFRGAWLDAALIEALIVQLPGLQAVRVNTFHLDEATVEAARRRWGDGFQSLDSQDDAPLESFDDREVYDDNGVIRQFRDSLGDDRWSEAE